MTIRKFQCAYLKVEYSGKRKTMKRKNIKNRGIALFMAVTLAGAVLCSCGAKDEEEEPATEINFADITNNNGTGGAAEAETQTEELPTEEAAEEESHEGMYRSEITNEWIDESLKDQRPVAIMVDNETKALPHYGLTEADVVYELMNSTANGRITRLMAIVKDWGKIEQFGSIRSTRPTNIMLAAEWNAVLVHDGGPFYIDDWIAKDYSANFSGGFTRVDNGKAREYTEYVCTGDLDSRFANSKYSTEYNEYYPGQHFNFSNSEIELTEDRGAIDCTRIELPFPHNESTLEYNESTGTYDYSEYGKPHTDPLHDNARLTFKNLFIQDCTFAQLDENGYMIYNAIDSGRDAYYITNGKAVEVVWIKAAENEPTIFLDKQTGEKIEMNTGKTYIALVPSDSWDDLVIQ